MQKACCSELTADTENRLTAIPGTGVTASFVYAAAGQRVNGAVNGVTTVYIFVTQAGVVSDLTAR